LIFTMSNAIQITGRMDADAQARRTRDGQHLLLVSVALPGGVQGKPMLLRVTKDFGAGPAADIACKTSARYLRRGVCVSVGGTGLSWRRGVAHLDGVSYLDTPDFRQHRGLE
jgi:hypothetical protein